jgi:hypothetical protein
LIDITGIVLSAVLVMFLLSGPRGKNRNYPLAFGAMIAVLAIVYAVSNRQSLYYVLAALGLAKGFWDYRHWRG